MSILGHNVSRTLLLRTAATIVAVLLLAVWHGFSRKRRAPWSRQNGEWWRRLPCRSY
jgi:hypothetical protein